MPDQLTAQTGEIYSGVDIQQKWQGQGTHAQYGGVNDP